MAHPTDVLVDLVTGQLTALAGLCALGHLDLQVGGVGQVVARYAEAARGDLLDSALAAIAVGVWCVTAGVFTALARVAAGAYAVHRDRHRLVRLTADRAQRGCAGSKALDDVLSRLDLLERNRVGFFK